jgi:hypothetical protein
MLPAAQGVRTSREREREAERDAHAAQGVRTSREREAERDAHAAQGVRTSSEREAERQAHVRAQLARDPPPRSRRSPGGWATRSRLRSRARAARPSRRSRRASTCCPCHSASL